MAADYSKMTNDDFDRYLASVLDDTYTRVSQLLNIPGIYEILSEYFNNETLEAWADDNPELAYPTVHCTECLCDIDLEHDAYTCCNGLHVCAACDETSANDTEHEGE